MKHVIFILILGLAPWLGLAQDQNTTGSADTSTANTTTASPAAGPTGATEDTGEAGGIDPTEITSNTNDASTPTPVWVWMGLGGCLIIGFLAGTFMTRGRTKKTDTNDIPSKVFVDERVDLKSTTKETSPADARKWKEEIKILKAQLLDAQNETAAYKKNLDIHADFDQKYYGEAFRKLVSPMNDAMEKGSKKEIIENLLKMMSHYSSLTRYKISKKQPYDEANMQYLMNQRLKNDVAIEIDRNTPIDKIPKNIKTLVDLLAEQASNGLDDSIISGYKIKNL